MPRPSPRPLLPLLLLLTALPAAAADATLPELPELLTRLEAAERARDARREGTSLTLTTVTEELDGDGKVTSRTEVVSRRSFRNGESSDEVVRATKDGEDVTAGARKQSLEAQEKRRKEGKKAPKVSPFAAENQPLYRFTLLGPDPKDASRVRIGLSPREKREDLHEGEALVDVARGALLRLTGRPSKLPAMASRADVRYEYDVPTPTGLDLGSFRMEGEGGILFVRKRMRITGRVAYAAAP
jgi:hypothetical protein